MIYTYFPKGTCSRQFDIDIQDDIIVNLNVLGGCNGNLQGISKLVVGRNVNEVLKLLEGIRCGNKPTSCPDQIAEALKAYKNEKN